MPGTKNVIKKTRKNWTYKCLGCGYWGNYGSQNGTHQKMQNSTTEKCIDRIRITCRRK